MRLSWNLAVSILLLLVAAARVTTFSISLSSSRPAVATSPKRTAAGSGTSILHAPQNPILHITTTKRTTTSALFMISGSSLEALREELPSQTVINAIVQSSQTSRGDSNTKQVTVVAADVAATAGVSLAQAQRDLSVLASLVQGDLAVDESGELLYTFSGDLAAALAQSSVQYKVLQTWQQVWPVVFWGLRITFGAALVASIAAIFSTIFFLQTSSSSSDSDDRRDNGNRSSNGMSFGGGWSYWWGPSPFDFFYYRPYGAYGYYGRQDNNHNQEEMGFLESVFSYVFGDGNPNASLDERRLTLAAQTIRRAGGSVTAEQLAPFCDPPPNNNNDNDNDNGYVDESYVLPIVTALNGEPRVTPDGDIVYVFGDLQVTAQSEDETTPVRGNSKEALLLRRAGLSETASTRDIARLLEYSGYRLPRRRGAVERAALLQVLEQVVPPLSAREQEELELASETSFLQEREWQFSVAPDLNKGLAAVLGIVNLGGAAYLGNLLGQLQAAQAAGMVLTLPPWLTVVQGLYPALLTYAVLFNVIPLVRNFWIQQQNAKIRQRNQARRNWKVALAQALESKSNKNPKFSRLRRKLQAAKTMGRQLLRAGQTTVFDTAQTTLQDLQQEKSQRDLQAFDQQLQQEQEKQSPPKELPESSSNPVLPLDDKINNNNNSTVLKQPTESSSSSTTTESSSS